VFARTATEQTDALEHRPRDREGEEPERAPLPLERLEDELAELAAEINAGTCRWLELVAEFDRRDGWGQPGVRSCADWLSWRCAVSPSEAREQVRVAHKLCELPLIRAAFSRGELSYAKVRALTRVADERCEEELLELAGFLTASQLERALRAYRRVTSEEARDAHEAEFLSYFWDEAGSLLLRARLPAEDGALLLRALEAARDSLRERRRQAAGVAESAAADPAQELETDEDERGEDAKADEDEDEPREDARPNVDADGAGEDADAEVGPRAASGNSVPGRPPNVEALLAIAETALAQRDRDRSGGERCQVVVHVDAAVLSDDREGRCELADGPALAPETARRLGCDASFMTLIEREGEPLSFGRRTRTVPPALRRALTARDRGCRFPGCTNERFVDAHHIEHWARGGETSLDNLLLLCRRHHRLVHEGGYSVEVDRDGQARFRDPGGFAIPSVPRSPPAAADDLRERNRRSGLAIDAETCSGGLNERMDLALTLDSLLGIVG
jgi:hypothetical protein